MTTILIVIALLTTLICAGLILGACMASARINRDEEWLEERPLRVTSTEPVPAPHSVRTSAK